MVLNCGVALGIPIWGATGINFVFTLFMIYWSVRYRNWGGGLMAVGGAGNFVLRINNGGCVVDNWRIPVIGGYNNLWDWLVAVGVVLAIGQLWRQSRK